MARRAKAPKNPCTLIAICVIVLFFVAASTCIIVTAIVSPDGDSGK